MSATQQWMNKLPIERVKEILYCRLTDRWKNQLPTKRPILSTRYVCKRVMNELRGMLQSGEWITCLLTEQSVNQLAAQRAPLSNSLIQSSVLRHWSTHDTLHTVHCTPRLSPVYIADKVTRTFHERFVRNAVMEVWFSCKPHGTKRFLRGSVTVSRCRRDSEAFSECWHGQQVRRSNKKRNEPSSKRWTSLKCWLHGILKILHYADITNNTERISQILYYADIAVLRYVDVTPNL